ncbi:MAG: hypothetical protein NWF07_13005 [Candidatus Bathyarchaeota archaeon]|nr:hypothetical protein [Candidatus Bathyarchaeota archaeon]
MRKKISYLILTLILVSVGLSTWTIEGSIATSEPPTDEFMAENADIIVICKVTSVEIETYRTLYNFESLEAIKGTIPEEFSITTGEGVQKKTTPTPVRFDEGQEYVVYLSEEDGKYSVFWEEWGKTPLNVFDSDLLGDLRDTYKGTIELDVHPVFFIFLLFLSCVLVYFFYIKTSN